MGNVRGRRHVALAKERQHLPGGDLGDLEHEVMLARSLIGLSQDGGCAGGISPSYSKSGEEHLAAHGSVGRWRLSGQLETVLPVLLGSIEVVPLVAHTGQAKVGSAGDGKRQTCCLLCGVLEALDGQIELVVHLLNEAQADPSHDVVDLFSRLAHGDGFGVRTPRLGAVSLELVGVGQLDDRGGAEREVVGVQVLEGTARLAEDGLRVVPGEGQRRPHGGDATDEVPVPIVCPGA